MADMDAIVMPASDVEIDMDDPIGRGGYGTVYRGEHINHGTVAVKIMSDGILPKRCERGLLKEAKHLKHAMDNPHIVNLIGVIMERGNYSLVMEYMTFGSSTHFVKDFKVDVELLVRIVSQVVLAMDYLHGHTPPILHLDLKADNVLIDRNLNAKICDFGLSQWKTVTLTMTHSANAGRPCTLTHIAPEVLRDINVKSNAPIDVYAFACTLWEIFSAQVPYENRSEEVIRQAVLCDQRPSITALSAQCPTQIKAMITRCWHANAQLRPTFAALKKEIEPELKAVEPAIPAAMKNMRKQVCDKFAVNDIEFMDTKYIDELVIPGSSDESNRSITPPMSIPTDPATIMEMAQLNTITDQEPPVQQPGYPTLTTSLQTISLSPKMTLPKPVNELTPFDIQVRQILRDPLALELINSEYGETIVPDEKVRKLFADPQALMDYINKDTELKLELERSHSPVLANIHGPRRRAADVFILGQEKTEQDIMTVMRGRSLEYRKEEVRKRQEERTHREETMNDSSYLRSRRGIAGKLAKALKDAPSFRDALKEPATGTGGAEKFEVVEKAVLDAATDSVLLQIVLAKDKNTLDYLVRNHPDLLMELLAKNTTSYRSHGGMRRLPVSGDSQSGDGRRHPVMAGLPGSGSRNQRHTEHTPFSLKKRQEKESDEHVERKTKENEALKSDPEMDRRKEMDTKRETDEKAKAARNLIARQMEIDMKKRIEDEKQQSAQKVTVENLKTAIETARQMELELKENTSKADIEMARQMNTDMNKAREMEKNTQLDDDMKKRKETEIKENESMEKQKSLSGSSGILSSMSWIFNDPLSKMSMDEMSVDMTPDPAPIPTVIPGQTAAASTARGISPITQDADFLAFGNTSTGQPTPEKPDEVEPLKNEKKGRAPSPTESLSISHKHGDGAFTQINLPRDMSSMPNIQVGSKQTMIINNRGDGASYKHGAPRSKRKENIQLSTSTQPLNKDQLDNICNQIGADWRKLCRELKLKDGEIEQLRQDFLGEGVYEVTYQAIRKWIQRNTKASTVKAMAEVLHNIDRDDLARNLK